MKGCGSWGESLAVFICWPAPPLPLARHWLLRRTKKRKSRHCSRVVSSRPSLLLMTGQLFDAPSRYLSPFKEFRPRSFKFHSKLSYILIEIYVKSLDWNLNSIFEIYFFKLNVVIFSLEMFIRHVTFTLLLNDAKMICSAFSNAVISSKLTLWLTPLFAASYALCFVLVGRISSGQRCGGNFSNQFSIRVDR